MKRQLSSVDIHYLVKELKQLEGSRIDKIHQSEKNLIVLSLFKSNEGKRLLQIDVGKSIYIADKKEEGETLGFGMLLRKHLDGMFLESILQAEPERIIEFVFASKEAKKSLFVEFFGKGNAILCENGIIINSLEHHEFKDRTVKPKEKYIFPSMKYDLFSVDRKQLKEMFSNSKKDSIITSLATELGLGGVYAEEVCMISGVDKSERPKDLVDKETDSILKSIKKITSQTINPVVYYENDNVIDFAPFELEFYKGKESRKFSSFNEAALLFYSQFKEVKETEHDKRIKGLLRIIEEQKLKIEEMGKEEDELRSKGELIYHKYADAKEIIDELNKASKKYSWKEIKEKLKGHSKIKEFNEKDRKVVVEF